MSSLVIVMKFVVCNTHYSEPN